MKNDFDYWFARKSMHDFDSRLVSDSFIRHICSKPKKRTKKKRKK